VLTSDQVTGEQRLKTALVRDAAGFSALRQEWDDLYRGCPSATPFSSWEWLYSWWEVYGEGKYGLRLITLREEGGLLVGLLPLMVRRRRLLLLGDSPRALYWYVWTPYKDVLVREGWERPVARVGAQALKEMGGWWVADLQELMPQAAAWGLFRSWEGPQRSFSLTEYFLIRTDSWEELLSSLSRNLRSIVRRTLRRAEEDGLRREPAGAEEAERAARILVALHRELLVERRIDPEDLTPKSQAFIERVARRMTAREIGRISEFRRADGELLVSQFLVFDKDFVGVYMVGASKEASRRYQFMTLCNWDAVDVACSRDNAYVSWMMGNEGDKLRWATEVVSSQRMILGRTLALWVPYAGYYILYDRYYALRAEVQVYVHSEDAPHWIRNATRRYYALVEYVHSDDAPRWIQRATEGYYELRSKYGYGWLGYQYELARARREIRRSNDTSRLD